MKRYEFIEHTADVKVRIYGGSLKELFASAALAMFAVIAVKKKNKSQTSLKDISFEKTAQTLEDLLKCWLDELLFYFSSEHLVLHRIKSLNCEGNSFQASVLLEPFDSDYFNILSEIKAVTYHELKVEKVKEGWQAFVIFDV